MCWEHLAMTVVVAKCFQHRLTIIAWWSHSASSSMYCVVADRCVRQRRAVHRHQLIYNNTCKFGTSQIICQEWLKPELSNFVHRRLHVCHRPLATSHAAHCWHYRRQRLNATVLNLHIFFYLRINMPVNMKQLLELPQMLTSVLFHMWASRYYTICHNWVSDNAPLSCKLQRRIRRCVKETVLLGYNNE